MYEGALSGLYVPLRFRGQTIGVLCVESLRKDAFNLYDESLMVVIASHLASLADYTRLREEAEGRARNLGLIHEVVQQVIGLTDPREVAEITSDLLARYFAYELCAVFIADEKGDSNHRRVWRGKPKCGQTRHEIFRISCHWRHHGPGL